MNIKKTFCIWALSAIIIPVMAQEDPIVMTINGVKVPRSEFEYNYNKNNTDGVLDRKSVKEYVPLFVNYKLKVQAALDHQLDTLSSFQKEFRQYRDLQIRPLLLPQYAMENECKAYYQRMVESLQGKPLILPAHIFIRLPQTASEEDVEAARQRMDSVYVALQQGADFAQLASKVSQDTQTAVRGGVLGWLGPNQTLQEFEDVAYSLEPDSFSKPFLSTVGYHIVKLMGKRPLESYEELAPRIRQFLESQGLEDQLASQMLDSISAHSAEGKSVEQILDEETERLCAENPDLNYLVKEYYEGLLFYEECSRYVWEPARVDTAGLKKYFKSNKKQYAWKEPHFRGLVYYCQSPSQAKAVKKLLKKNKKQESKWVDLVRSEFNKDSVTVKMEYRMFKQGENVNVDSLVFGIRGIVPIPMKGYPCMDYYGVKLKKGPKEWTDVGGQLVTDYQQKREEEYVEYLRKRYPVEVDEAVLETVNKH